MNEFLKRAMELNDSIQTDRAYLHQNAEVGNELPVTTKYVMDRLAEMGIEAKEICKSGVLGMIRGKKPGKVYLLRAPELQIQNLQRTQLRPRYAHRNAAGCCKNAERKRR